MSRARLGLVVLLGYSIAGAIGAARWVLAETCSVAGSRESLRRAIAIAPGNAAYHLRLAEIAPDLAVAEYQAALALNRRQSDAWVGLAIAQELAGDLTASEQSLLESARYSVYCEPRWRFADFYWRHNNPDRFRVWAREALLVCSSKSSSVFGMARKLGFSGAEIGSALVPNRPPVLADWIGDALDRKELAPAAIGAHRLLATGTPADRAPVFRACDDLLAGGLVDSALELWNALAGKHWIPYEPLPNGSHLVTNGEFAFLPMSHGFDWRLDQSGAVSYYLSGGLHIQIHERLPPDAEILRQFIPVRGGARFVAAVTYRTEAAVSPEASRWEVARAGGEVLASESAPPSRSSTSIYLPFESPNRGGLVALRLLFNGAADEAGEMIVQSAELRPLPR